jgi:hypothetical protein
MPEKVSEQTDEMRTIDRSSFSLTSKAKDLEQSKQTPLNSHLISSPFIASHIPGSADIYSLLVNAQEKFQETVSTRVFLFCFIFVWKHLET